MTMNNPATEDLDLNGFRARNSAASGHDNDLIRRGELSALILQAAANSVMLRRDGVNSPTADIPFANRTLTGIRAAVAAQEPMTKGQVDAALAVINAALAASALPSVTGNIGTTVDSQTTAGTKVVSLTPGLYAAILVGGGGSGSSANGGPDGAAGLPTTLTMGASQAVAAGGRPGSILRASNVATTAGCQVPPEQFISSVATPGFAHAGQVLSGSAIPGGTGVNGRTGGWLGVQEGGGAGGGHLLPGLTAPTPELGGPGGTLGANGTVTTTPFSVSPGTPSASGGGAGSVGGGGGGSTGLATANYQQPAGGRGGGFGAGSGGMGNFGDDTLAGQGGSGGARVIVLFQITSTMSVTMDVGAGGYVSGGATAGRDGAAAIYQVS